MSKVKVALWALCLVAVHTNIIGADEWGNLRTRFVYDGAQPTEAPLNVTTDIEFCGKFGVVDESLKVNEENKGIANVFAYLYLGRSDEPPTPHPSYQESADAEIILDNCKCRFAPHCAVLRTTQTLVIGNSDDVGHNCKIDTILNSPINYTIPAGGDFKHQFKLAERLPARVSCSIHPWMSGWLLVRDNPYMAVSDEDGQLTIANLPTGTWTIQFWHERIGYVSNVTRNGNPAQWSRGRLEVTIEPGENDLGEIHLTPSDFAD